MKPICFFFIFLFLSLRLSAQDNHTRIAQTEVSLLNKRMPVISANDITGKKYNSEAFKDKVVFLNFWFTDCPPCIQELDQLSSLYQNFADNPAVVFLSVTFDNLKDIQSFISRDTIERGGKIRAHYAKFSKFNNNIQYPIISSPDKKIEKDFKINAWPASFIIDKKGIIRLVNVGLKLDEPEDYLFKKYSERIKELLAE